MDITREQARQIFMAGAMWEQGTTDQNFNETWDVLSRKMKESKSVSNRDFEFRAALTLLRDLADIQNGAPLVTVEEEWNEIMDSTYDFLEQHEVNGQAAEKELEPVAEALEIRTDSESGCSYCSGSGVIPVWGKYGINSKDCFCRTSEKES